MVTVAPGTRAPVGSLTTPRSDVVAVWENAREAQVRMQHSIQPHRDRFTTVLQVRQNQQGAFAPRWMG